MHEGPWEGSHTAGSIAAATGIGLDLVLGPELNVEEEASHVAWDTPAMESVGSPL